MKQNEGCALERRLNNGWRPLAIRYQKFTAIEKRALDQGETIKKAGVSIRRSDWAERQALRFAFQ